MLNQPQVFVRIATSPYLPKFPPHIPRLLTLLEDPAAELPAIAAEIDADVNLRELILQNLNSNGFATHKKIETVEDALLYWGLVSARNMIVFFIIHSFYPAARAKQTKLFTLYRYWTHVLATAVAGEALAQLTGYTEPFRIFTYGLLHDIGILAIDACLPEEEAQILLKMHNGKRHLAAEREVLGGMTHEDVGAWVCKREGFPADIACAVQHHHTPAQAEGCHEIAALLAVANILGTEYIAPSMPVNIDTPMDMDLVRALGLAPADLEQVRVGMPAQIRRFTAKPIGL